MKKTIWITGTLLVIGIAVILMYFSFFQEKGSSAMPEGTFVKEVGDETRFEATLAPEGTFAKGVEIKGVEAEWRQSA